MAGRRPAVTVQVSTLWGPSDVPEGPHSALCPVRSYQPKPGWMSMQAVSSSPFRARALSGAFSSALGAE